MNTPRLGQKTWLHSDGCDNEGAKRDNNIVKEADMDGESGVMIMVSIYSLSL